MFLLRAAFWLTVVILFLPGDPENGVDAPRVSLLEAFGAVRSTVSDLSQFCDRNPDVCETGSEVVGVIADKARYGIEQVQEYLSRQSAEPVGTLTTDDVQPPWHDPASDPVMTARAGG